MVNNNYPVDLPKTYTVSYFDEVEWNKGLTTEEQKLNEIVDKSYFDEIKSQEKGYGPTCSDCRWDNPDCPHYLSQGYIPLYLSCPARGCGGDGNQYQWKHYNCGDNMYISEEAYIKCIKCNVPRHWKQWLFKCYLHKGEDVWREAGWGEFNYALGLVSKLWENKNPMTRIYIDKIAAKVYRDK